MDHYASRGEFTAPEYQELLFEHLYRKHLCRLDPWPDRLPDDAPWRARCRRWRDSLLAQSDLTSRLLAFVASKR